MGCIIVYILNVVLRKILIRIQIKVHNTKTNVGSRNSWFHRYSINTEGHASTRGFLKFERPNESIEEDPKAIKIELHVTVNILSSV